MARLYILDLHPLLDSGWQTVLPQLPQDRQERIQKCAQDADRARLAGSGWLLRQALIRSGIAPDMQHLKKTELGKLFLQGFPDLHFSLSHSGTWAVCALAQTPVGVDIELPRCTPEIARRFFHPDELPDFSSLPETQWQDQLNRLWTAKEAFTKALGGGLTIPMNRFLVRLSAEGAQLEQSLSPLPYRLHEYRLEGARICLCSTESRPEPETIFIKS